MLGFGQPLAPPKQGERAGRLDSHFHENAMAPDFARATGLPQGIISTSATRMLFASTEASPGSTTGSRLAGSPTGYMPVRTW